MGYVPFDKEAESVSKTLEYAYDDYCIAQAAKKLGKEDDYHYFLNRALSYQTLIDPETKYMRGRDSKGDWRTPFTPVAYQGPGSVHGWGDITEGFTMQYTWYVPQDVQGYINEAGKELFRKRNGQSTYVWNAADEVVVGDKSPDAQGSFGINVAWKGFYLNTTFLYQWGAQDYNETIKNKVEEADIDGSNVDRRVLTQRWQNPGDIAPFFDLKNKQKTQPTSRFVQDNNYLAFSSISCGYDFNRDLIRKMRLTSLGLRFNMNDVCRWSNIKQERGTSYPYAKNYSFTLSLGF